MFSYKLFQTLICLSIAIVYSQTIKPSFEIIKENPRLLYSLFKMTIVLNAMMLVTFLYELTFYSHKIRTVIFKTMLTKVFVTMIAIYFIAIIYSHWIQSLIDYSVKSKKEMLKFTAKKTQLQKECGDNAMTLQNKLRYVDKPSAEIAKARCNTFNAAYFEISEYFDYLWNKLDLYCAQDCDHFLDEGPNSFGEAMRRI